MCDNLTFFAGDLWVVFNFEDPNKRYRAFLSNAEGALKRFIDSIILYDEIVVPSQNMMSLTVLIEKLGEPAILSLLESGKLRFLRTKGHFGYKRGKGIESFVMKDENGSETALSNDLEKTIEWALSAVRYKTRSSQIVSTVLEKTSEIDINSVLPEVRDETYADILSTTYLRNAFRITAQDLTDIPEVDPTIVSIYGGPYSPLPKNQIENLLALSFANLELKIAASLSSRDSSSASPMARLLKAKVLRATENSDLRENFMIVSEINDVSDIGEGVLSGTIEIPTILKLTESSDGKSFRKWFHENYRGDPKTVMWECGRLLRSIPNVSSLPSRMLRFLATSPLAFIAHPEVAAMGTVAEVIDNFFIDRWFKGKSPKFFLEDISKL